MTGYSESTVFWSFGYLTLDFPDHNIILVSLGPSRKGWGLFSFKCLHLHVQHVSNNVHTECGNVSF